MGCSSSQQVTSASRARLQKTSVTLSNFDWDKECRRNVKDFPMYEGRLQPIDWERIVDLGLDWKDPNFPLSVESLLEREL